MLLEINIFSEQSEEDPPRSVRCVEISAVLLSLERSGSSLIGSLQQGPACAATPDNPGWLRFARLAAAARSAETGGLRERYALFNYFFSHVDICGFASWIANPPTPGTSPRTFLLQGHDPQPPQGPSSKQLRWCIQGLLIKWEKQEVTSSIGIRTSVFPLVTQDCLFFSGTSQEICKEIEVGLIHLNWGSFSCTSSSKSLPLYLFRRLVASVGVHGQYGVPGAHEEHAGGAVQEEGAEVGHAPELTRTD